MEASKALQLDVHSVSQLAEKSNYRHRSEWLDGDRDMPADDGDLVEVSVPGELLPEIQANARRERQFRLRLAVEAKAPEPGGLTLFGARAGRYGVGPTIRVKLPF